MMIPESDGSFSTSDGWLMEILMKLGSARTILSALCRSIEKANSGIAVALVCPDRQSGKLTHIVPPVCPIALVRRNYGSNISWTDWIR